MSSISIMRSEGVVIATALAVSGAVFFISVLRDKNFTLAQLSGSHDFHPKEPILRSCLSSGGKRGRRVKKSVRFADSVKDPSGNGEEFRKYQRRRSPRRGASCGIEALPENGLALYEGIVRDRVHRVECSY
ncbi:hypothetical protein RJ639_017977 [Escallonia herrerae]|uniref:Uncharacterized protein n=1 Tax=Escallonia herrerae TaxID=1293975 RepID=A0AA89AK25_9ASTE|nr:hypothetical protein RJ639_017977 [Escallonia herrerae]